MPGGASYQPQGYPAVSAYIMADDAERVIEFLAVVVGGQELTRLHGADGRIMHAAVRIGDSVVMLADATEGAAAFPIWMHVYVPDVDAAFARALGAGGISVMAPVDKGDGDKRGGVMDPSGNTWWLATPTS